MARLDDPTLRIDKPRPDFRAANPEAFARAQGDPNTTRRLCVIEDRASGIKNRFRAHFERHEEAWVVREALSLWAKRSFPTLQHPRPAGHQADAFADLMMGQARRNVHARALKRLSTINTIKSRLQNAIVRSSPGQTSSMHRSPSNDRGPEP